MLIFFGGGFGVSFVCFRYSEVCVCYCDMLFDFDLSYIRGSVRLGFNL